MKLLNFYLKLLSKIWPQKAERTALSIFLTPRRHSPKAWEVKSEESAKRIWITKDFSCLVWGKGKPILLVHGWEGRGSQMSVFVPYLASKYKLIAIDAPAHGGSKGSKSSPNEFIKTIFKAQEYFGEFEAIIGHSMGGGCSIFSAIEGLKVKKVVSISGPSSFKDVAELFGKYIGLNNDVLKGFLNRVEEDVQLPFEDLDLSKKISSINQKLLLVHDTDDEEVPYSQFEKFQMNMNDMSNVQLLVTGGLGHRRIMKDEKVLSNIKAFID
jgi:pimeloyl-ACP methyl ester carboxylesterase